MNKPICITFAAPIGVGKSHISTYLSWNLNLPIFSTNAIRTEVHDDTLSIEQDPQVYRDLSAKRFEEVVSLKRSFIFDTSVDRKYQTVKERLEKEGYEVFVISIDLSKEKVTQLLQTLGYTETLARLDSILADHQNFLDQYKDEVELSINDENFKDRLKLSLEALRSYLM